MTAQRITFCERSSCVGGELASEQNHDGKILSEALKAVRKERGMSAREVAAAMNMLPRTYQRFEAGTTRFNLDHVHRFAKATSSDPYAFLISVAIASSRYARNTADNMLSTVLIVGVQKLEQALGDKIRELDTRTLVAAISAMFDALAAQALGGDPAQTWLDEGRKNLSAKRPKPGR